MTELNEFCRPICCSLSRQDNHRDTTSLLDGSSPVRNDRYRCEIICLLCLGLIFVMGLTTGIYLLFREGDEETFTLITRIDWNATQSKRNLTKPDLPMKMVEIFPLVSNGDRCENDTSCFIGEADITFNFLLDNDGRVYEGRGWEYSPDGNTKDGIILSVGLIGNSGDEQLSDIQLKSLVAFFEYAVSKKRLVPCFQMTANPALKRDIILEVDKQVKRQRRC